MELTQEKMNAIEQAVSEYLACHEDRVEEHIDGYIFHSDVKAIFELDSLFLDGAYTSDLQEPAFDWDAERKSRQDIEESRGAE